MRGDKICSLEKFGLKGSYIVEGGHYISQVSSELSYNYE
jgi:hypothetical protein